MSPPRRSARLRGLTGDSGFTLVEVLLSMTLVVTVMAGSAGFFSSSLLSSVGQRQRQTAVVIAQKQLEFVRSIPPQDLLDGRRQSDVQTLETALGATVLPGIGPFPGWNYAASAVSTGLAAAVPLCTDGSASHAPVAGTDCPAGGVAPLALTGTVYIVRTAIDTCIRESTNVCDAPPSMTSALTAQQASLTSGSVVAGPVPGSNAMFRVTVDVSWPKGGGLSCASYTSGDLQGTCHTTVMTLIDRTGNPSFVSLTPLTVTSTTPATLQVSTSQSLTITGTNFEPSPVVTASGACTITGTPVAVTSTTINGLTIIAGASPGTCVLTVTNQDGLSAVSPPITVVPACGTAAPLAVPAGASIATVTLSGGQGGAGGTGWGAWAYVPQAGAAGGLGAALTATFRVQTGETLAVTVGCGGRSGAPGTSAGGGSGGATAPGYGSGGAGGGGTNDLYGVSAAGGGSGGGASSISCTAKCVTAGLLLVAGGGGGGGGGAIFPDYLPGSGGNGIGGTTTAGGSGVVYGGTAGGVQLFNVAGAAGSAAPPSDGGAGTVGYGVWLSMGGPGGGGGGYGGGGGGNAKWSDSGGPGGGGGSSWASAAVTVGQTSTHTGAGAFSVSFS